MIDVKNKMIFVITIIGFLATIGSYGVSIGRLAQRVDNIESRTTKVETLINDKLETTIKTINNQTVQIAVLSEKVDQLKSEIKNDK